MKKKLIGGQLGVEGLRDGKEVKEEFPLGKKGDLKNIKKEKDFIFNNFLKSLT